MSACSKPCLLGVSLEIDDFGKFVNKNGECEEVKRFTWKNKNNVSVQLITYGGTITSIQVPDKNGKIDDVVTGFNTLEEYMAPGNRYFGASIGRCANRICKGTFTLQGELYKLAINNGENALHGGVVGFDKVNWKYTVDDKRVILSYLSKDMEEGYPGDLIVNITFELRKDNKLWIEYKASTTRKTIVNLTNHSYFNLAGVKYGADELYKHVVTINADRVTEVNEQSIPTGNLLDVGNSAFDLRVPKVLGEVINTVPNSPGFDHNFCINNEFVARVSHPPSGRVLEVRSNQPGVQFYTANFLPENDSLKGKEGVYKKHGAFCLETQNYPDAINHDRFPSPVLLPGDMYHHTACFKFLIENN